MRIEVKENGYNLVEEYKSDKGRERHIWHFNKQGIYINKTKETIKYEPRNKK